MSSVNQWAGTGLGGDAYRVVDGNGREVYKNGRPERVHCGSPEFAERAAAERETALHKVLNWVDENAPVKEREIRAGRNVELGEAETRLEIARREAPRYFRAEGTYWTAWAGQIEEVPPADREWIEAQERRGNHVLTDEPNQVDYLMHEWGFDTVVGRLESTPAVERLAPTEPARRVNAPADRRRSR